jgi:hypothetical protein
VQGGCPGVAGAEYRSGGAIRGDGPGEYVRVGVPPGQGVPGQDAPRAAGGVDDHGRAVRFAVAFHGEPAGRADSHDRPPGDQVKRAGPSIVPAASPGDQDIAAAIGERRHQRAIATGDREGGAERRAVHPGQRQRHVIAAADRYPHLPGRRAGEYRPAVAQHATQLTGGTSVRHEVTGHKVQRADDHLARPGEERHRARAQQRGDHRAGDAALGWLDADHLAPGQAEQLPAARRPEQPVAELADHHRCRCRRGRRPAARGGRGRFPAMGGRHEDRCEHGGGQQHRPCRPSASRRTSPAELHHVVLVAAPWPAGGRSVAAAHGPILCQKAAAGIPGVTCRVADPRTASNPLVSPQALRCRQLISTDLATSPVNDLAGFPGGGHVRASGRSRRSRPGRRSRCPWRRPGPTR